MDQPRGRSFRRDHALRGVIHPDRRGSEAGVIADDADQGPAVNGSAGRHADRLEIRPRIARALGVELRARVFHEHVRRRIHELQNHLPPGVRRRVVGREQPRARRVLVAARRRPALPRQAVHAPDLQRHLSGLVMIRHHAAIRSKPLPVGHVRQRQVVARPHLEAVIAHHPGPVIRVRKRLHLIHIYKSTRGLVSNRTPVVATRAVAEDRAARHRSRGRKNRPCCEASPVCGSVGAELHDAVLSEKAQHRSRGVVEINLHIAESVGRPEVSVRGRFHPSFDFIYDAGARDERTRHDLVVVRISIQLERVRSRVCRGCCRAADAPPIPNRIRHGYPAVDAVHHPLPAVSDLEPRVGQQVGLSERRGEEGREEHGQDHALPRSMFDVQCSMLFLLHGFTVHLVLSM
ncbi:MAG: hypothetical protein BWY59_00030 [Verrucomicrobia bacterium ADurb.Bin345]|nr:MAG: hypothetical protein BWY59_00030 [Verrucomicrobia bacterium ADurb.Bin345]